MDLRIYPGREGNSSTYPIWAEIRRRPDLFERVLF